MERGDITLVKIDGKINPSDILTKPKSAKEMARLTEALSYEMPTRKQSSHGEEAGVLEVARWMSEINREKLSKNVQRVVRFASTP